MSHRGIVPPCLLSTMSMFHGVYVPLCPCSTTFPDHLIIVSTVGCTRWLELECGLKAPGNIGMVNYRQSGI